MKKHLAIIWISFIFPLNVIIAQNESTSTIPTLLPRNFQITKVSVSANIEGTPSLSIDFIINLEGNLLNTDYFISEKKGQPKFHITYAGKSGSCDLVSNFTVSKKGFGVKLTKFNAKTLQRFLDKDNKISLQFDEDLTFEYSNPVHPQIYLLGIITKEDINNNINKDLSYPANEKTNFLTALNNFYYYQNSFDFGVQPGADSSSTSYALTFNFQNAYNSSSFLKCSNSINADAKVNSSGIVLYYGIFSRLSTNFKDSLNFLNIYPLIIHEDNYNTKYLPFEWNLKFGHESNQSFTNKRIALDASISTILPNLINVTSETSKRLRLKPEIDAGIKEYYDYSNTTSKFYSGQAYLNAYYYIPVYDSYAVIINDKTFYDFSQQKNPHHQILSNYTIQIGTDVPKTGFKVMLKYQSGNTDINFKQSQAIVIGLLMNVFNEKQL